MLALDVPGEQLDQAAGKEHGPLAAVLRRPDLDPALPAALHLATNVELSAEEVDVGGLEPGCFAQPQSGEGCQRHVGTKNGLDQGPAWISNVRFSKTWQTAYRHDRTLARWQAFDSNFYDIDTKEEFWLSGPKRDRTDARYSSSQPTVDEDARDAYEAFLRGAPLPGRERG